MDDIPISLLLTVLVILILLSAFFSASETSMMAVNRYRLKHKEKQGNRSARRVTRLLHRPDRLIGLILLGNNFVNFLAASLATVVAIRLLGEYGAIVAPVVLTAVVLIFAEVTPKTFAAVHPEMIAFPASHVINVLLRIFYPFVWILNSVSNGILGLFGISAEQQQRLSLSREELRSVLHESEPVIPVKHRHMLLSILDLERATVDDIMIPRNEIIGIDLDDDWDEIVDQLKTSQHTRLLVFKGSVDEVKGILHLRSVMKLMASENFNMETLLEIVVEPYFVPEGTPLMKQLLNFQKEKQRMAVLVDEYGDIQGLATLEDILEEIVGEFTTDVSTNIKEIHPQEDGSFLIDGSVNIRDLNRALQLEFPTDGPKTLNGIVLEYLETIPEPGTSLRIGPYPIEIVHVTSNAVKTIKIDPKYFQEINQNED